METNSTNCILVSVTGERVSSGCSYMYLNSSKHAVSCATIGKGLGLAQTASSRRLVPACRSRRPLPELQHGYMNLLYDHTQKFRLSLVNIRICF